VVEGWDSFPAVREPAGGPNDAIGLVLDEVAEDSVSAHLPVTPAVLQPYGTVHGGVYSLVAESLCSVATDEAVRGDGMTAMGMANQATLLRPISSGTVHARATRRHAGRTTWIWDVEITDDEERLCAMVRMTLAVRPRPG